MPIVPEIQMEGQDVKQVKRQLMMISVFLFLFVPLLIALARALTVSPQPPENWIFGVIATCFVAMLVIVSGWYWALFAIHVRSARFSNDGIVIERFLAPRVQVPHGHVVKQKGIPTPSFNAPYHRQGILFVAGMSSFYVPDNLTDAQRLIE